MKLFPGLAALVLALVTCLAAPQSIAQQPPVGPTETYKGVKLIGTGFANRKNTKFFHNAKIAIDMVRKLPKAEWNQTDSIRTLIYYPPHPDRVAPGITANIVGVYSIEDYERWPAPVVIYKNMLYSSGLEIALSIVGNGINAASHRRIASNIRLVKDMEAGRIPMDRAKMTKARREADYGIAMVRKEMPPEVLFKLDCENRIAVLNSHRILHNDRNIIGAMNARLSDDGCL